MTGYGLSGVLKDIGSVLGSYLEAIPKIVGKSMTESDGPGEGLYNLAKNTYTLLEENTKCIATLSKVLRENPPRNTEQLSAYLKMLSKYQLSLLNKY